MTEVICSVISGACAIICAVVGAVSVRAHKRTEAREKLRREEALLSLQMTDACLRLSVCSANALLGGHNNGNVEEAKEAAQRAQERYTQFMQETTASAVCR